MYNTITRQLKFKCQQASSSWQPAWKKLYAITASFHILQNLLFIKNFVAFQFTLHSLIELMQHYKTTK